METINRKLSEGSGGYTVLDSNPTIKVANKLGVSLLRLSGARFESKDGKKRVVGVWSKVYPGSEGKDYRYWFGYRFAQQEFLSWQNESWIAFECGAPSKTVLFPRDRFEAFLKFLSKTEGVHWHVEIMEAGGKFFLQLPLSHQEEDITEWLIS